MGILDVWYCPNHKCPNQDKMKKDETCPDCGFETQPFGLREVVELRKSKNAIKEIEDPKGKLLVTDKMTDNEIKAMIYQDMRNLAMHEAGTGWMRVGTLLKFNSTEQLLGAGFKALIDQNKIIIRQNELIIRQLKKKTETQ